MQVIMYKIEIQHDRMKTSVAVTSPYKRVPVPSHFSLDTPPQHDPQCHTHDIHQAHTVPPTAAPTPS